MIDCVRNEEVINKFNTQNLFDTSQGFFLLMGQILWKLMGKVQSGILFNSFEFNLQISYSIFTLMKNNAFWTLPNIIPTSFCHSCVKNAGFMFYCTCSSSIWQKYFVKLNHNKINTKDLFSPWCYFIFSDDRNDKLFEWGRI